MKENVSILWTDKWDIIVRWVVDCVDYEKDEGIIIDDTLSIFHSFYTQTHFWFSTDHVLGGDLLFFLLLFVVISLEFCYMIEVLKMKERKKKLFVIDHVDDEVPIAIDIWYQ